MILKKLKLSNFRCFGANETVVYFDKLTTLIGANSTGKTAAMQALVKLFSPTPADREIHRADFHVSPSENPETVETKDLYIEAIFQFPELTIDKATKTAIPSFFKYFVVDEPGQPPYLRIRLESTFTKDDSIEGAIDTRYFFIRSSETETAISDSAKIGAQRSALSNVKCIYVPALRNPSDQLRNVSGTILYRLLSSVEWPSKTTAELQGFIENINSTLNNVQGVDNLQTILQEQWSGYHRDTRYANATIAFNSTDLESTLKTAGIRFSPTEIPRDYDVSELGDGLRSLFYFSLVNTLLKVERNALEVLEKGEVSSQTQKSLPPVLTILVVEEPENHIAPQLMGRVILNLKETAAAPNAQVVLSSHTPAIVKRVDATCIRYFRMDDTSQSTVVSGITLPQKEDEAYKYVKEAIEAYPEVYFARLVILGEGDSEIIVLPKIIDRLNKNIDVLGIAVAPLGGRHVNHFWRLLNQLRIPHISLLDLDRERYGGGWGRIKYALKQLIENGTDKNALLQINGGTLLSDEQLDKMHEWPITDTETMAGWIERLKSFNVYFSAPLDLDFLLLENYPDCYKGTVEEGYGPYITALGKISDIEAISPLPQQYLDRANKNTRDVLKDEGGDGSTYLEKQKHLMIWYKYLFLDRSKPVTHLKALSSCDFSNLETIPEPLRTIINKVTHAL